MTVTEQIDQQHQEDLQRLRGFRLLDDDFLTKCFEGDPQYIQLVLRIVLEMPDLVVVDVRTQVFVENLLKHSVRLDILATDSTGRKINVEIQPYRTLEQIFHKHLCTNVYHHEIRHFQHNSQHKLNILGIPLKALCQKIIIQ